MVAQSKQIRQTEKEEKNGGGKVFFFDLFKKILMSCKTTL